MVYVYLIEAEIEDVIQYKIGVSKHPDKRINELKTANPNITDVKNKYNCENREYAFIVESLLHKKYLKNKINGEWYLLEEDDILMFEKNCKTFYDRAKLAKQIKNNINII